MKSFKFYENSFIEKASSQGYSVENINKCIAYAKPIFENNLPIIYNTSHLSLLVGYNGNYIRRAVVYGSYFYRSYHILKKNGKTRILQEPLPSLKEIQHWILNNILYKIKVSKYAKAYVSGRGIRDHAKYHTKEKRVLTLDIKTFFDKIPFDKTEEIFLKVGYSKSISNILTKLCYLNKKLPQGAPTSPCISNLVLREFDENVALFCAKNKYKYTRYADDMAFSGDIKKTALIKFIKIELRKVGLLLNNDKTKLMLQNVPQLVSGIVVNTKAQVPKIKRNAIRNEMFFIKKFGITSHVEMKQIKHKDYLRHMIGKVGYVLSIYPKDNEFIGYRKYLFELKSKR